MKKALAIFQNTYSFLSDSGNGLCGMSKASSKDDLRLTENSLTVLKHVGEVYGYRLAAPVHECHFDKFRDLDRPGHSP